jgi:phage minor structural protein
MIVYFADRQLNILGQASTELPHGLTIVDDLKTEDVETGVAVFECTISFNDETRKLVESCTEGGNYILRSYGKENEFFTIIDAEIDTKKQEVTVYAEDAGLDLLNEICGPYEAEKAETLAFYVTKFAYDSGFKIGVNQATGLTRKLMWDGEATATERIASVATQFDGCEVSYSFEIKGLQITDKFINIYKQRGKDIGAQLRLNKEIDRIITKKSVANLATGLYVTGGTPEDSDVPISLDGYKYDDGDFFVQGPRLYSRKAGKKWSRYNWTNEPNQLEGASGYIVKPFNYDTTDQKTLFSHALAELKKVCDMEVNYEVDISKLPDDARIGDRVNIIDDAGELYMSARILMLETSAVNDERKATLGEYLMKSSGISQKVADLAAQFAKTAVSAARALAIANNAKSLANAAQAQADSALADAEAAQQAAEAAQNAANTASASALDAQKKADAAQSAVDTVEENVASIEKTVNDAQAAADNAYTAAETAQNKADEAAQAAAQAKADAADAKAQTEVAQGKAETAITKAEAAQAQAESAKAEADTAKATADAAKLDAEKAAQDIDNLANTLETV